MLRLLPLTFFLDISTVLRCVCVSCAQQTDNVTLSTALAVQRFVSSCDSAILQANNRSDDAAVEQNATLGDAFGIENTHDRRTLERLSCPRCTLPNVAPGRLCCGNGNCSSNGTCQCDKG